METSAQRELEDAGRARHSVRAEFYQREWRRARSDTPYLLLDREDRREEGFDHGLRR